MSGHKPRPPDIGPRKAYSPPRRAEFASFALVFDDRVIIRTPYNAKFVDDIKQVPPKLRSFVKDGRPLEGALRKHLETNEVYFASTEELATIVEGLVGRIAAANGLSDAWVVALAAPELFEFALAVALQHVPDLELYDVRVLAEEK
jgi:hypothetical protein